MRRTGFTMVEMMVAVILGSLVMLGLAAIFSTILKFQVTGFKRDVVQGGGLVSLRVLTGDLQAATGITSPTSPCPNGNCADAAAGQKEADVLSGCTNWETNSAALLDTTGFMRTFHFCVDAGEIMYYHWRDGAIGAGIPCPPAPLGACNTAIVGWSIQRLADGAKKDPGYPFYFRRPAGMNNVVELHYMVQTTSSPSTQGGVAPSMTINTAVAVQKAVTGSDP